MASSCSTRILSKVLPSILCQDLNCQSTCNELPVNAEDCEFPRAQCLHIRNLRGHWSVNEDHRLILFLHPAKGRNASFSGAVIAVNANNFSFKRFATTESRKGNALTDFGIRDTEHVTTHSRKTMPPTHTSVCTGRG